MCFVRLVGEGKATHARLDAQDVVVHGEHLLQRGGVVTLHVDSHLGVINAREVAGAGWLVLLGLQSEGVHVDAGVWHAGVVHVWLVLVEVLALLLLEAVLAVQHQLEVVQRADLDLSTGRHVGRALLHPADVGGQGRGEGADLGQGVREQAGSTHGVGQSRAGQEGGSTARHVHVGSAGGEVPQRVVRGGAGVGVAPDELLHWVVERQTDGLGALGAAGQTAGSGGDGIATGVLHLLNQVLVALLGEAAALLRVQVHVVGPHLEHGAGAEVQGEVAGQVEVQAHLVVLQGNQGQVQAGVAVEEEQQRQVHAVGVHGISERGAGRGHLAVVDLLRLGEEQLGVQAPPGLVVLVNALATDGQLNVSHGALGNPAHVDVGVGRGQVRHVQLGGLQADVHVTDQVAVAGDGHGHTATVGGGTVHRLLDVLHRKVSVALVHSLEESHLGLARQVHVLRAVSNELHKSSGHDRLVLVPKKKILTRKSRLVRERETSETRLDTKDVVVDREHALIQGGHTRLQVHGNLGHVDTAKVARAAWLQLLRLEGERIHVDTRVRHTRVVHVRLILIEILSVLGHKPVRAVQDDLGLVQRTHLLAIGGVR